MPGSRPPLPVIGITMVYALCVLAVAAAASVKLAASLGPVVRCEPCDARALAQCKPLAQGDCEPVREPGCGCCTTCALRQGQHCGVYTERCASGLTCLPQAGASKPLQSLLEGRGVCTNETARVRVLHNSAGTELCTFTVHSFTLVNRVLLTTWLGCLMLLQEGKAVLFQHTRLHLLSSV